MTTNYGHLTIIKGKIKYQRGAIVSNKKDAIYEKEYLKKNGWYSFIKKVGKEYVVYRGWRK